MGWWGGRGVPLCRLAVTRCHDVTNPSCDDLSHRHTQHSQLMTPGEKKYHPSRPFFSSSLPFDVGCQFTRTMVHYEQDNYKSGASRVVMSYNEWHLANIPPAGLRHKPRTRHQALVPDPDTIPPNKGAGSSHCSVANCQCPEVTLAVPSPLPAPS